MSSDISESGAQRELKLVDLKREYDRFTYIISHDLNANFRGIRKVADWFQEDYSEVLDEGGKELLDLLVERVDHTQTMLAAILEFSRIGRIDNRFIDVDLNDVVRESFRSLCNDVDEGELVERDGYYLEGKAPLSLNSRPVRCAITPLPIILADQKRIMRLFRELIKNSIEFNDKECCELEIDVRSNGSDWLISVADNGIGIQEEVIPQLFDLFYSADRLSGQRKMGIGLALAKRIVEMHGGSITVQVHERVGFTVTLQIPQNITQS